MKKSNLDKMIEEMLKSMGYRKVKSEWTKTVYHTITPSMFNEIRYMHSRDIIKNKSKMFFTLSI